MIDDHTPRAEDLYFTFHDNELDVVAYPSAEKFLRDIDVTRGRQCCILARIDFPGLDGLKLLHSMNQAGLKIPTILLSECATAEIFTEAAFAGALGFFEGDYDKTALLERVGDIMLRREPLTLW